jgi:hypothetical protein
MTGTVISTVATGLLGAGIKLTAGLLTMWLENKRDERAERLSLVGQQIDLLKMRPDPASPYASTTRRVLAFVMCFTFCAVVLLWAIYPHTLILIPDQGSRGWALNLLLFNFSRDTNLAGTVSTGAIVWAMLPFISMILMTYFTPDVSKIR